MEDFGFLGGVGGGSFSVDVSGGVVEFIVGMKLFLFYCCVEEFFIGWEEFVLGGCEWLRIVGVDFE